MHLTVSHRTIYRYGRPVALRPHRLMLCPRGHQDLRLLDMRIDCSPVANIEWTQDVFGNLIATASFAEVTDELTIESKIVVDQSAVAWPVFSVAPSAHSFPFTYAPDEVADLGKLRIPQAPLAVKAVREWIAPHRSALPVDTLTLLQSLNADMAARLNYVAREEEGTQSPEVTIANGRGSCRDFATLFIEAVRQLGFGARAVSGYLQTADDPGEAQHGTTHAWAEVYLPCAGWIAFDPTHARMGSKGLIPVAVARTIEQIRPVAGSYIGSPDDYLDMSVSVSVTSGSRSAHQ